MLELTSRSYRMKERPVRKLPRLALGPRGVLKSYRSHLFGPAARAGRGGRLAPKAGPPRPRPARGDLGPLKQKRSENLGGAL